MPKIKGNLYNRGSLSKQAENIVKSAASGGLERLLVEGAKRNYASRVNGDSHRRQGNTHKCNFVEKADRESSVEAACDTSPYRDPNLKETSP